MRWPELAITKKAMISPGTTLITATDGNNPEKGFEFQLSFQQIFFAFWYNISPMKKKAKSHEKAVLQKKIISVPSVEGNLEFKTLDIRDELTNTGEEQLTNVIKRYRQLFPKKSKWISCMNLTAHVIRTGDAIAVHCSSYKTFSKKQDLSSKKFKSF